MTLDRLLPLIHYGYPVLFLTKSVYHWHCFSVCYFWHYLHFVFLFLLRQFLFMTIVAFSVVLSSSIFLEYNRRPCFANLPSIFFVVVFWIFFDPYCFFVHLFSKTSFFIQYFDLVELNFVFAVCGMFRYCTFFCFFNISRFIHVILVLRLIALIRGVGWILPVFSIKKTLNFWGNLKIFLFKVLTIGFYIFCPFFK